MNKAKVNSIIKYGSFELVVKPWKQKKDCEKCFFNIYNCRNIPCQASERNDLDNVYFEYTEELGIFKNAKVGDVINFRGTLLRVSSFTKTCAHCFLRNLNCECIPCTASGDGDTVIYELVKPL